MKSAAFVIPGLKPDGMEAAIFAVPENRSTEHHPSTQERVGDPGEEVRGFHPRTEELFAR